MPASRVPVIDGSQMLHTENVGPDAQLVQQVSEALSTWGFFQLVNHGLDKHFLDKHLAATKRFFSLPAPVKEPITRRKDNAMGFCSNELTKQRLDIKQVFDYRNLAQPDLPDDHPDNYHPSGVNQWPEGENEFRQLNHQLMAELIHLAFKLLEVISASLGLPDKALHPLYQPAQSSRIRLNFYPVTANAPENSFGVSHHKDSGFLTLLLQDEQVPGLQVHHAGEWHLVEPIPGALTINAGDMLQVLSNDRFTAANHRVLKSSSRDRYSRVLFFNPDVSATIQPRLPEGSTERPHYRPINYGEFYLARLDGNYADLGEEVQIDWYRISDSVSNTRAAESVDSAADATGPAEMDSRARTGTVLCDGGLAQAAAAATVHA